MKPLTAELVEALKEVSEARMPGAARAIAVKALAAIRARSENADGWRTMESAPKDGTLIEVRGNRGPYGVTAWCGIAKWYLPTNWHRDNAHWASDESAMLSLAGYHPTHWRQLPAPPVEEKKD